MNIQAYADDTVLLSSEMLSLIKLLISTENTVIVKLNRARHIDYTHIELYFNGNLLHVEKKVTARYFGYLTRNIRTWKDTTKLLYLKIYSVNFTR